MKRYCPTGYCPCECIPSIAVPVVPNFTQGSMTSNTETTSTVTETINSMNYNTGYQYVITGTNIQHDGNTISAPNTTPK